MTEFDSKVSVILPVYNNAEDVVNSIESVVCQTYKNWELVVIDDFSIDGSYEEVDRFRRKNPELPIKCIRNEKNYGVYVSINEGILRSSGRYITVVGSDDIIHSRKLQMQVMILDADNEEAFGGVDHLVARDGHMISGEVSLMVRKSLTNKIGFYDSVRFAADTEFRNRVRLIAPIVTIGQVLYFAKKRSSSLTASPSTGNQAIRRGYVAEFTKWHRRTKCLYMNYPIAEGKRPFPVHHLMLP